MSKAAFTIKVAFGGDAATGKTSIVGKMANPDFDVSNVLATVGIEHFSIGLKVNEGTADEKSGVAHLIDVPGSEGFQTVRAIQYRNSDFVILVFALGSRRSFESLSRWYDRIKDYPALDARYIVVGNKADLAEQGVVSEQEACEAAQKFGKDSVYFKVSALNGEGINDLKDYIAAEVQVILRERQMKGTEGPDVIIITPGDPGQSPKNDECC
jgi:small GTP-binding protein